MAFLEERFDEVAAYGASGQDMYSVSVHETGNGYEYLYQRHPFVRTEFDLTFNNRTQTVIIGTIRDLFNRAGGNLEGFRFKNPLDYTTNGYTSAHTYSDQECVAVVDSSVSPSVTRYQIYRWYGTFGVAGATRRRIRKPVDGTVLVGLRNANVSPTVELQAVGGWSVDTTTGLITFDDIDLAVSNITQAAQAVVTVGTSHGIVADDTVFFSGIGGMTEINNTRASVVSVGASTITVDVNTTAYTAFSTTSPLGRVKTAPQANETVLAGCEFDIPVRFEDAMHAAVLASRNSNGLIMQSSIKLIELLNA